MFKWLKRLFKETKKTSLPKTTNFTRACNWDEFKGNITVVERLQKTIIASQIQGTALPNILFYGPAGCGKTTLAKIVANVWQANLFEITGSSLRTQLDLVKLVSKIGYLNKKGQKAIVFVDEVHGIVKGRGLGEDIWLPLLEQGVLHHSCVGKTWKEGKNTYEVISSPTTLSAATWIGATTDPGLLNSAIRRRFPVTIALEEYSIQDIEDIVQMYCTREGISIDKDALHLIASRSRYRPAIAIDHLLRQARDEAIIDSGTIANTHIQLSHVLEASRLAGISESGIKDEDLRVLGTLYGTYPEGKGLKNLADSTDLSLNIVQNMVLPFLQIEGWVKTTHKRFLTEKGKTFYEQLLKGEKDEFNESIS